MSIESLVDRIIGDTKKASAEIEQRAREEARVWEEEAEREAQRIAEAARQRADRMAGDQKQRMIAMAELEHRKEVLRVKQEVIEEAFNRAIKKILSLDTARYGDFLIDLILRADPQGDEEILLNERDRGRFRNGWVRRLNQRLERNRKKGKMRICDETRSIQGGAVLRKGRKETNCSLESMILSRRTGLEGKVAGILFKDSE